MNRLTLLRRAMGALLVLIIVGGCTSAGSVPTSQPPAPSATRAPAPTSAEVATATAAPAGEQRVVGYFVQWGIYDRAYLVKNIQTSGAAEHLTHINYAFSNIDEKTLTCKIGDSFADYEKVHTAGESIDGIADTSAADELHGNFNQLHKLKKEHPDLKIMISIGGWTWSKHFSKAAMPENRAKFVASCIDMFISGNFTGKLQGYSGIFDGIDVDWEYPGACGLTCDFLPEDTANFTALLAEFRSQLDALEATTGKEYLLTIAQGAVLDKLAKIELGKIHTSLDFINLMAYDFHGAWDKTTGPLAAVHADPADPNLSKSAWGDAAVQMHLDAGVPAAKLVLGVVFYGRGWTGVAPGPNGDGLYQAGSGPASGKYEAGVDDYKELVARHADFKRFFNPETQAFYVYDGSEWWSYDTPETMEEKMRYVKSKGLGGAMFWELSGDTGSIDLLRAISEGLRSS